jgi:GTP pyrophosphokinase
MTIADLITKLHTYSPGTNADVIQRAYEFSAKVHRGQRRLSGKPYLTHPLEVAGIIAEMHLDAASIATGLLHDTVEDTLTTLEQIQAVFGAEIGALVDGVTKISQINLQSREEKQAENFRKMVVAMGRDIRVILIKLADRTHNMRTLGHVPPERQGEIAQETIDIYAPLAHRLGIYWLKNELEDNALRYLHPEVYYQLKRNVAKRKAERDAYIKEVLGILGKHFAEAGIDGEVTGRPKHFFSIYEKMQRQNLRYDQIYDLVAFRVLVDSVSECYEALGIVHARWKPVPGRFKDHIALPKANRYQSLHTTVIGPYGERMEVQIRTREMHRVAEYGIAAHWRYKGTGTESREDVQRFAWLRQLLEWQHHVEDPDEFLRSVKDDLFTEEVFVFTPKGDVLDFPLGATIIDFAYRIHSEVGNHCSGARVNGRLVPLRYQLQNGDTVEIVTTPQQTPSRDWLKITKTTRAKARVRSWTRSQQRDRSVALGQELLERDFQRHRLDLGRLRRDGTLERVASELGTKGFDGLLATLGYGRLSTRQVLAKLLPADELERRSTQGEGPLERLFRLVRRDNKTGVSVSGMDDILVRFGRCCHPLPGERITGFITRGRGVTVHAAGCSQVLETDMQRRVDVRWEDAGKSLHPAKLEVTCIDEPGLLAAMSKAISSTGVNIRRAQARSVPNKMAVNSFEVMVGDINALNRLIRNLSKVRGVLQVERVRL